MGLKVSLRAQLTLNLLNQNSGNEEESNHVTENSENHITCIIVDGCPCHNFDCRTIEGPPDPSLNTTLLIIYTEAPKNYPQVIKMDRFGKL